MILTMNLRNLVSKTATEARRFGKPSLDSSDSTGSIRRRVGFARTSQETFLLTVMISKLHAIIRFTIYRLETMIFCQSNQVPRTQNKNSASIRKE